MVMVSTEYVTVPWTPLYLQISKVNQLRIQLQTVTISPPWASIASNGILRVLPGPHEINVEI
jgi:hypothetical protein